MSDNEKIVKVVNGKVKEAKDGLVTVYVSTPNVDRDKEIIPVKAWDLKNYKQHPILLSSHKYDKLTNQIGKAIDDGIDEKGLWMTFEYFIQKGNFEADWGYFLATQGLASYSVGFIPTESHQGTNGVRRVYDNVELLEVSQVLVPANPEAVQGNGYEEKYLLAIKSFQEKKMNEEEKGAIPYKKHPLADEGAAWDAGKEIKEATPAQLKEMCAWYDSSKPDIKSSYKLPHHLVKNYVTVWRGVAAAMAALLGARGGVNIPDSDRKAVYNHLAKHYEEFGKKPPEFKQYANENEILQVCSIMEEEEKAGRVISEANRKKIENAIEALKSAEQALNDLLKMSETNSLPLGGDSGSTLKAVVEGLAEALAV